MGRLQNNADPDAVCVVACGIFTSLGKGYSANLNKLLASEDGLKPLQRLRTVHRNDYMVGEIQEENEELLSVLTDEVGPHYTRTALLSGIAIKQISDNIPWGLFNNHKWAFINASTSGGMGTVEEYYPQLLESQVGPEHIPIIKAMDCAESTMQALRLLNLKPQYTTTISTACSSSANALIVGAQLVSHGEVDMAICGGSDAFCRFALNGFLSLKNIDREKCKPFDAFRGGLNLGEGAAYLLLMKRSKAHLLQLPVLAVLSGYANCNDTYHQTAPSPDGSAAFNTMRAALEKAKLTVQDIDYINAHGTATENNDSSELIAIEQLFNYDVPYSSTKSFIGHTLAAAGAIEAIFSIMSIQEKKLWPNLRWQNKMEQNTLIPITHLKSAEVKHVLSNSFGFGGNNVSLLFSEA